MAETNYTDIETIADRLRTATGRVTLGYDEPKPGVNEIDMSYNTADSHRTDVEREIELRVGRFYAVPLALVTEGTISILDTIACKKTCYEIWSVLNPEFTNEEIPSSVRGWYDSAEMLLERIVPKGKTSPKIGRDIILDGETMLAAADDPSVANFKMTASIPWGKTTS